MKVQLIQEIVISLVLIIENILGNSIDINNGVQVKNEGNNNSEIEDKNDKSSEME